MDEGQKFALERGAGYVFFTIGLLVGLQSAGVNFSSIVIQALERKVKYMQFYRRNFENAEMATL